MNPSQNGRVMVVDDEDVVREVLYGRFIKLGYDVIAVSGAVEARGILSSGGVDVIISDIKMPQLDGVSFLKWLSENGFKIPLVLMTGYSDKETAIAALKAGAYDYIEKPFDTDEVVSSVESALELSRLRAEKEELLKRLSVDNENLSRKVSAYEHGDFEKEFIGSSAEAGRIKEMVGRVSSYDSTVLITGSSGSGKEIIARLIHAKSDRSRTGAFIGVNCAAIPTELLESELFGYEKGAFTGATTKRQGLFELAHRGTIFLDEIGDMELALQAKVLRVLEDKKFRRVGGRDELETDVRVIAATNRNIQEMIEEGSFREDLYYRLNVFNISLPGLRDRGNDVLEIADYFVEYLNSKMKKSIKGFSEDVKKAFLAHDWNGNVRELRNVIERAFIMCDGDEISTDHIELAAFSGYSPSVSSSAAFSGINPRDYKAGFRSAKDDAIRIFEIEYIKNLLQSTGGNVTQAALASMMDRSNFLRMCRKYNIKPEDFRQ
ncbi:MAG: sigma-54-dependent Fis family transcriptional regulator [Oligoflexia bacterium]|nr:sigma-54-dependent Fis family transcriptional regulator [Oligoflexia bacterium]